MQQKQTILAFHQGGELYGSDLVFLRACRALSDQFSVAAYVDFDGPLVNELRRYATTTTVTRLAALRKSTVRKPLKFSVDLIRSFASLLALLIKNKRKAGICYVNTLVIPLPLITAKILGYKTVSHIHETLPRSITGRILYTIYSIFSDELILVSRTTQEAMLSSSLVECGERTKVIYNGIDMGAETLEANKECLFKIVFVGRISERKGLHILLEALTATSLSRRAWTLEVIGDGVERDDPYLGKIEELLGRPVFRNRVHMAGFRSDARRLLRTAHLFVFPSVDFDSFPTVVLEAMAENVPIIATNSGGAAEMLENGITGILVEPGSISGLEQAITSVLDDPDAALVRARNARKRVEEQFSLPIFERRFGDVFKNVTEFRSTP